MIIRQQEGISDYSSILANAIANCQDGETLEFENGMYPVCGGNSPHTFCRLSNNDPAEKAVALYIKERKKLNIKGNGATLFLTDFISGIGIENSEEISISDLNIDYAGNYHFELEVEEIYMDRIKVKKREGFNFEFSDGEIFAEQGKLGKCLCMEFDKEKQTPYYREKFVFVDFSKGSRQENGYFSTEIYKENEDYYIKTDWAKRLHKGSVLIICYVRKRYNFSAFISSSKNIKLNNINIAYSPSMGIIAQLTENISLCGINIKLNGRHGLISSVCDATHFVQCSGKVVIKNSNFYNMMDDATNFHGNYMTVSDICGDTITAQIMHAQQEGVNLFCKGDEITVYKQKTIDVKRVFTVLNSEMKDGKFVQITVDGAAASVENGDTIYNGSRMPEIEIDGVCCGNNRPRGFLLNSPKKTVVRNCVFSNSEHGIELAGDSNYWYESGGCSDVLIENCIFKNCNHANGDYAIRIEPIFDKSGDEKYYHKNVKIINNKFIGFQNGMVYAKNVEHISVIDNEFIKSDEYPERKIQNGKIYLKDCLVDKIRNNRDTEELLTLLSPIWEGNYMYEQTAVFVGEHDTAPLMFPISGKATVVDFSKNEIYEENKDYCITDGGIMRTDGRMPFFMQEEFYRETPDEINVGVNPEKLTFPDGKKRYFKFGAIHNKTVRISYPCEKSDIFGLNGKTGCCEKFKEKLKNGENATILFYGDSITEGANASAELRVAPYQEIWPILSYNFLKYYYKNEGLRYVNTAVGGKDSIWGLENFEKNVLDYNPDLLVLAFGMNDGGKSVQEFYALADSMLSALMAKCPQAEVILVATSVPNPQSHWYGNQCYFINALNDLSEKYGFHVMDMTSLTIKLYGENGLIRYRDFTGNNVNHPNDFGVRLYGQVFLNLLMGEEYRNFFKARER